MTDNTIYFTDEKDIGKITDQNAGRIIKFGREGYDANDIQVKGDTLPCRRHSLIINCKNDIWLYDLNSYSGTFLNGEKIKNKAPLIGLNRITIAKTNYCIKTDKSKLL